MPYKIKSRKEKLNLKDKTVLVYDFGIWTELAATLAKDFKKVYYFIPWQDSFPSSQKQMIGKDFKGLERIQNFWDYVDKVDMIVSFDTYCGDMVDYLREQGYSVWGAGKAEMLELNRWKMRTMQKQVGLPTQPSVRIKSVDDLILYFYGIKRTIKDQFGKEDEKLEQKMLSYIFSKYDDFDEDYYIGGDIDVLKKEWINGAQDKYIKSNIRGDIETFFAPTYDESQSKFNLLLDIFGHRSDGEEIEFTVEQKIEGVEPGFDGIQINGEYLSPTMWGIEHKGSGYLGVVCDYDELPESVRNMNEKMSVFFKDMQPTCSFFSTEFILDKNGDAYLIDPTVRNPGPVGSALYSEIYENFSEIIWNGAHGKLTVPKFNSKYGAGCCLDSDWADKHELEVEIDDGMDDWVKFRRAYMKGPKYFVASGFSSVCSVIALGDDVENVIELVKERVRGVHAYELSSNVSGLDKIMEELKDYKKLGFKI